MRRPPGFDAAAAEAQRRMERAEELADLEAMCEIAQRRSACLAPDGGCEVLRCMHLAMVHRLAVPNWLRDEFARRYALVAGAHVGSFDAAFGRPWPQRTRMATARRRIELCARIHRAVWKLVHADPTRRITRDGVFNEVGAHREVALSGGAAEKLYYVALRGGAVNVADWRDQLLADLEANTRLTRESGVRTRPDTA